MKKRFFITLFFVPIFCNSFSQNLLKYPHLREADVMWAKRIWQVIDLRQKMNHPLYYPLEPLNDRKCLFHIITKGLLVENSMVAFGLGPTNDDDEFHFPMSKTQVDSILNPILEISYEDLDTGETITDFVPNPITADKITRYKIKEDWLFDKQRSERYVRIIGIMPMIEEYNEDGSMRGYRELFWLYYPNIRYTLVNYKVFNPHNRAQPFSFDALFQKRLFSSYIVKEENVYDRTIQSYTRGIDALLESDRIKRQLFEFEHDLWNY